MYFNIWNNTPQKSQFPKICRLAGCCIEPFNSVSDSRNDRGREKGNEYLTKNTNLPFAFINRIVIIICRFQIQTNIHWTGGRPIKSHWKPLNIMQSQKAINYETNGTRNMSH